MRVRIEHQEKSTGPLRAAHQVEVVTQVQFSQAERLIIEHRGLEDFVVLERLPDSRLAATLAPEEQDVWDGAFHLRIRDLTNEAPDRFTLDTPSDAKAYQARLTDALRQLKIFIEANADLGSTTVLEL
mgnify:CR=1 FL=1